MPEEGIEGWPGARVKFRGLRWEVVQARAVGAQMVLRLRCADAGLSGLEWVALHPAEPVARITEAFRPHHPIALAGWRLRQTALVLGAGGPFGGVPGRLRVEPYQLVPLLRMLDLPRPRLLLADDVGLGKTIEACLVMAGLMARRAAHRVLVIVPAGPLLAQWDTELRLRFGLAFRRLDGLAALNAERRHHEHGRNPFEAAGRCLISLDFAKQEHVLEELERVRWDLAIIDEAHHCMADGVGGESSQRRRLAEVIAGQSDGLLLLTATPHDGIEAHFASLLALLDPGLVDAAGRTAARHRSYVVRRLKGHLHAADGSPRFAARRVIPVRVDAADARYAPVRAFHAALAALVVPRIETSRAPVRDDDVLAFVGLLKRSVSSIAAAQATLRVVARRYRSGRADSARLRRERSRAMRSLRAKQAQFGVLDAADEAALARLEEDGMAAQLGDATLPALLALIRAGEAARPLDPKLDALLAAIADIRGRRPGGNILVFTEYVDSQAAAVAALRAALPEDAILAISGADAEQARIVAAARFAAEDGLVMVSTDALAEGLNLHQRCRHLIHLDLPYNPNRLEQRNGRIDRFGQEGAPEIRYLFLGGTFEEELLLRLITRHEQARASVGSMPETLGATSVRRSDSAIRGFAQRQEELFAPTDDAIRTLDRAAVEARLSAYRSLFRDVEHAYDGRAAMRFGWMPLAATLADVDAAGRAEAALECAPPVDLPRFVADVVAMDTGVAQGGAGTLRLNEAWCTGLDGVPGFDAATRAFRFTRDPDVFVAEGRPVGFLGAAHPIVQRAIVRAQMLGDGVADARVSVASGELGVLLTYRAEISGRGGVAFSLGFAVLARRVGECEVLHEPSAWLRLAGQDGPPTADAWEAYFADWAPARLQHVQAVAEEAMQSWADRCVRTSAAFHPEAVAHRAATPTGDLFAPAAAGNRPSPAPPSHDPGALHPPRLQPTGLLMLVP